MRIFIGFFGVLRKPVATVPSIIETILQPWRRSGHSIVTAAHLNDPGHINNPRSGETSVAVSRAGLEALDLDLCWIESQDDGVIAPLFEVLSRAQDPVQYYQTTGDATLASLRNLLHTLRSLEQLWRLAILAAATPFDVYCFFRADLRYLAPLQPEAILAEVVDRQIDLVTPDWHQWNGLNDRLAFCSPRGARAYTQRVGHARSFCETHRVLQSELLLRAVAEAEGLALGFTSFRGVRVRADGREEARDFPVPVSG